MLGIKNDSIVDAMVISIGNSIHVQFGDKKSCNPNVGINDINDIERNTIY